MKASGFYVGLFFVTFATLMLQVIETRILSVALWYHLAFLVISLGMFGLTAGAVWVYRRGERLGTNQLPQDLARYGTGFALAIAAMAAIQMTLAPTFQRSLTFVLVWAELALLIAAPFVLSGVVVCLALTRSPFPIARVYAVDMLGAAMGCLGAAAALELTDGPSALLLTAAIAALGAWFFQRSILTDGPPRRKKSGLLDRPGWICLSLVAAALANGATRHGLQPLYVKDRAERRGPELLYESWNSYSRVSATTARGGRFLIGPAPDRPPPSHPVELRLLTIDGQAATPMYRFAGDPASVDVLTYDVTNLAHHLPGRERVAVIGVGGGRDVLSAWIFGRRDVTGIELNPIFIDLLTRDPDFESYAGLSRLPGVRFVVDEARSWLARHPERFDLVQMSMIDTWAATGAGAFTLSENGLYTVEAWDLFLHRLQPGGVLTVRPWFAPEDAGETARLISLAVATLLERGVAAPRRHLFAAATHNVATLIVSRDAWKAGELAALTATAERMGFQILLHPERRAAPQILQRLIETADLQELERWTHAAELDLSPPRDDRPFFFNQLPLYRPSAVLSLAFGGERPAGVVSGNLEAAVTLAVILALAAVLVALTIVMPLRPAVRHSGRRLAIGGTLWFVLLGLGFMSVEIGFLQRLAIYLGHPVLSLTVVLMGFILAAGAGSLACGRFALDSRQRFVAWALLTGGYLLATVALWPTIFGAFAGAPLSGRIALSLAMILPAGFLMGFGVPTALGRVATADRRPAPWLWGINGAAGVLGSVLAVATSLAFGISATVTWGGVCYFLLIPAGLVAGWDASESVPRDQV